MNVLGSTKIMRMMPFVATYASAKMIMKVTRSSSVIHVMSLPIRLVMAKTLKKEFPMKMRIGIVKGVSTSRISSKPPILLHAPSVPISKVFSQNLTSDGFITPASTGCLKCGSTTPTSKKFEDK